MLNIPTVSDVNISWYVYLWLNNTKKKYIFLFDLQMKLLWRQENYSEPKKQ